MRRTRRFGAVAGGLVVLALVAGCGIKANPSAMPIPSVTDDSPPASSSAAASSTAVTTPPPPPIAPPTVFSGNSDAVVPITKPAGATAVVATVSGNAAWKNFDVRAIDGAQDHLVATTAPYHGSVLLDGHGGNTTQLRGHAFGPWTITLTDARSAPVLGPSYSGDGDTVLLYPGGGGNAVIQGGASGSTLTITLLAAGRMGGPLVKATAPYSGIVRWPASSALVIVSAVGAWSIGIH